MLSRAALLKAAAGMGIGAAVTAVSAPRAEAAVVRVLSGRGHVQGLGWIASDARGVIGTTGRSLRLEAFRVYWPVSARVYAAGLGWLDWSAPDQDAGTTGQSRRLEALRLRLLPGVDYDGSILEYRIHMQDRGWLPWVRDGHGTGLVGSGLRIEALQARIVR